MHISHSLQSFHCRGYPTYRNLQPLLKIDKDRQDLARIMSVQELNELKRLPSASATVPLRLPQMSIIRTRKDLKLAEAEW
jgi:hypothetical protein